MQHTVTMLDTQAWVWVIYSRLTQGEIAEMQTTVYDIITKEVWDEEFERYKKTDWNKLENEVLEAFNLKQNFKK